MAEHAKNETQSPAERTVALLKAQGKTLACAESCTGGMIAERITDVPGASAVFRGGVVSYAVAVKEVVLGVSPQDIAAHSAVSAPVARQMAQGVRLLLHSDVAVSTTGVAGPGPDDRGNPQGTVYIALAAPDKTACWHFHCDGDRRAVREAAAAQALTLAAAHLAGGPLPAEAPEE